MNTQTLHNNTPVKAQFAIPNFDVPSTANVVIVGGGIAGTSLAYHFAKRGWEEVYLLEQAKLASGTTWHSAGQVGQLRSSSAQTKVNKASAELYARLESETGHDPGWLQCGGLQLASCEERMIQLRRLASMAKIFEVEAEVISTMECQNYWSMLNIDDLVGGVYLPGDGRVLPGECTIALAKAALDGGVKVIEGIQVTGLLQQDSRSRTQRITGVQTTRGPINATWVILAGNMWMRQLGLTAGIDIPVYPCEHHYVITKPIEGVNRNCPCTRDPDAGNYFRSLDDGGLKLGTFKKRSKPWRIGDQVPNHFAFELLEPDWPDFSGPFSAHMHRLNGIQRDDVVKFVNGPEAFTPDNNFILGQPHLTEGLFVAGGWNSAGIACAGGAGKYAVEWIENGGMTVDLDSVDILRFLPFQNHRKYLQERVSEVLGLHYQMAWPGRQMETAREVRSSALQEIHANNNACFGQTAGWERPLYFAPPEIEPKTEYSFLRQNWHSWVCEEVKACRENVAILDQSTFAKFELNGKGATKVLQQLCPANIDRGSNRAVYTGMLNKRGTFETDLTVVKLEQEQFYIVTSTSQQSKDFDWITRHLENSQATLTDVTERFNVISVMGPRAGQVLNQLCDQIFPSEDMPAYGAVKQMQIQGIPIRALRLSYVGEPGWEIHVEATQAVALYHLIEKAGRKFDIRPIGNHAISAMRIEKGFRAYGHELSPEETPFEAGLSWLIDWDKDFVGKSALKARRHTELTKRLTCFTLRDPGVTLWGSEPILWDNRLAGYTTSATFGPTFGASVAMGYLNSASEKPITKADLAQGQFHILQNGDRYLANASFQRPPNSG